MNFKLRPAPGKLLVIEDGFKYEGRIVIPDKVQKRPTTGIIHKMGEGIGKYVSEVETDGEGNEITTEVFVPHYKEGERVVYGLYSGTVVNIRNCAKVFRVLSPDDVLVVVEEGEIELEGVGT